MTEITLVGNLTADPDLRFTPTGKPVASLTVAVNKRVKLPDGSWENGETSYYRCTARRARSGILDSRCPCRRGRAIGDPRVRDPAGPPQRLG